MKRSAAFALLTLHCIILLSLAPHAADAATLVVLNKTDGTASLINPESGETVAVVPTGDGPHEVAIGPKGRRAVVANYGGRVAGNTFTVISIPGGRVLSTVDLGRHERPHGLAFLPEKNRVIFTSEVTASVVVVDIETGKVIQEAPTDQEVSHMLAVIPEHNLAFAANIGSGSVSAVDYAVGRLVKVIPAAAGTEGITLLPGNRHLWVTNRVANTATIIDTRSLEVLGHVPTGSFPIRAAATPDGKHVLVTNARSGDLSVFDAAARKELLRIPLARPGSAEKAEGVAPSGPFAGSPVPIGVLIRPDGRQAYVALTRANEVAVLDTKTWHVRKRFRTGQQPDGLGWSDRNVRAKRKKDAS